MTSAATAGVRDDVWRDVESFYRGEAILLQRREYRTWFARFLPEIRYSVPTMASTPEGRQPRKLGFYDEDHRMLEARVTKLESKLSWVEHPGSRTRYFIQVLDVREDGDEIVAISNVLLFQHSWNLETYYTGERTDRLVRTPDGFRVRDRLVILDREDLGAHGLSVFF